jgi:two-component system, cell cycle sensor histidine kinase and response regulator CckA
VVRDITERKRSGEERQKLEAQLQLAQKMEAVGRLAGGVAHDFNNLLSVILSYAGFATEALREGDPLRDDIEEIRRAGARAADLTRQLLAFSRRQVLEPKVLEPCRVVADMEKMLRRLIGEDVRLELVLPPESGLVKADPGQLEQVIMNLVVNARDAMPDGGTITIEVAQVELDEEYAARHIAVTPGSYMLLSISDTGCGMDETTRQRLFEPFFTTKEKGKGTGLGLSTVYGIVKQSGGNIWAYSEPGQGTVFKVYLPRVKEDSSAAVTRRTQECPAIGTETIVVVEDDDAVRNLTVRILRAAGFKVLTAANGGEALRACEQHPGEIHLLLTDVVMPQMSGRQLAERLVKVRPGLRVLYMSGYTDDAIVHHGVLEPGTKFVSKPFTSAELTRKVREALAAELQSSPSGHPS